MENILNYVKAISPKYYQPKSIILNVCKDEGHKDFENLNYIDDTYYGKCERCKREYFYPSFCKTHGHYWSTIHCFICQKPIYQIVRERLGYTIKEFAKELEYTEKWVKQIEVNSKFNGLSYEKRIEKRFKIKFIELLYKYKIYKFMGKE